MQEHYDEFFEVSDLFYRSFFLCDMSMRSICVCHNYLDIEWVPIMISLTFEFHELANRPTFTLSIKMTFAKCADIVGAERAAGFINMHRSRLTVKGRGNYFYKLTMPDGKQRSLWHDRVGGRCYKVAPCSSLFSRES